MFTRKKQINELHMGEYVQLCESPYGWGQVTSIDDQRVMITRPYLSLADFTCVSHMGGERVIATLGWEELALERGDTRPVTVMIERRPMVFK